MNSVTKYLFEHWTFWLLLGAASMLLTFSWFIELSAPAAFFGYSVGGAGLLSGLLWVLLRGVNLSVLLCAPIKPEFETETSKFQRTVLISAVIIALALIISASIAKAEPAHIRAARSFVGVTEYFGNNDGIMVEWFLGSVNRKAGAAWCAAFVSKVLDLSEATEPRVRSGMARSFKLKSSIRASDVLEGRSQVPDGAIAVWEKGSSIYGHTGFVARQLGKNAFETIEGNTSSGDKGSQADGDGVYRRVRTIQPFNHFRITSFTEVKYAAETSVMDGRGDSGSRGSVLAWLTERGRSVARASRADGHGASLVAAAFTGSIERQGEDEDSNAHRNAAGSVACVVCILGFIGTGSALRDRNARNGHTLGYSHAPVGDVAEDDDDIIPDDFKPIGEPVGDDNKRPAETDADDNDNDSTNSDAASSVVRRIGGGRGTDSSKRGRFARGNQL